MANATVKEWLTFGGMNHETWNDGTGSELNDCLNQHLQLEDQYKPGEGQCPTKVIHQISGSSSFGNQYF